MNSKLPLIAVIISVVALVIAIYTLMYIDLEKEYIMHASCDSLKIYLDAFEEGKGLFAYWTFETQETINFRITENNAELGNDVWKSRNCQI